MFEFNEENITILIGGISGAIAFFVVIYKRVLQPLSKILKSQTFIVEILEGIDTLKSEIRDIDGIQGSETPIKDHIIGMMYSLQRIESRQNIIEHRTKAALHYSNMALFETDSEGRLIWSSTNLMDMTKNLTTTWSRTASYMVEGFDWVNFFDEEDREDILSEFKSCLKMNRRFSKVTQLTSGLPVRLLGYPYKITESEHGGFLVSVTEMINKNKEIL